MQSNYFAALLLLLGALPTYADSGSSALDTTIGWPEAVIADAHGNIFFSSDPGIVFKLDGSGVLSVIAGGWTPGFAGDGGPATQARLAFPRSYPELVDDFLDWSPLLGGLAFDAAGVLYIADPYNQRIRKIDANGNITTVAGSGIRGVDADGVPALNAALSFPQGVALDAAGNLFLSDFGGLERVTVDGMFHAFVPAPCGAVSANELCDPLQISMDSVGDLYVADGSCDVQKISPTGLVMEVAGDFSPKTYWTCGYSGDNGSATQAALTEPSAVAVDSAGELFIADTYNNCIRRVDSLGIITTFAGQCQFSGFSGDGGPASAARLDSPRGVAVDGAGNVYIADSGNYRIRKVAADGTISTVAGNGSPAPAPDLVATAVTLTVSASDINVGGNVTLTAVVTGGAAPPGTSYFNGYVAFGASPSYMLRSVAVGPTFPASVSVSMTTTLAPGTYNLTASYTGNLLSAPSDSAPVPMTVVGPVASSQSGGGALGPAEAVALLLLVIARRRKAGSAMQSQLK
jgi:sugar lactone lactonase YvrE